LELNDNVKDDNGNIIVGDKDSAELFNKHFASVGVVVVVATFQPLP